MYNINKNKYTYLCILSMDRSTHKSVQYSYNKATEKAESTRNYKQYTCERVAES